MQIDEEFTLLINPKVEHIGDYVVATTKEHFCVGDYALIETHEFDKIYSTKIYSKISSILHPKYDIDKKIIEYRIVIISGYDKKSNEILIRSMGQLDRFKINPDLLIKKIKPGDDKISFFDEKSAKRIASFISYMDLILMLGALFETIKSGSVISLIKIIDPRILALLETFLPGISNLDTFLMTPIMHISAFIVLAFFFIRYIQDIGMDERLKRDIWGLKYASESRL